MNRIYLLISIFLLPSIVMAEPSFPTCASLFGEGWYRKVDDPDFPVIKVSGNRLEIIREGKKIYSQKSGGSNRDFYIAAQSTLTEDREAESQDAQPIHPFESHSRYYLIERGLTHFGAMEITRATSGSLERSSKTSYSYVERHEQRSRPKTQIFSKEKIIDFQVIHVARKTRKEAFDKTIEIIEIDSEPLIAVLTQSSFQIFRIQESSNQIEFALVHRASLSNPILEGKMEIAIRNYSKQRNPSTDPSDLLSKESIEIGVSIPNQISGRALLTKGKLNRWRPTTQFTISKFGQ